MMGQPGFFDLENRYTGLDKCGDPLAAIGRAVPFEMFRSQLQEALIKGGLRRVDADRKTAAGRKPWDEVLNNRHLCRDCQDFRVWRV
jgi:IS5 family transposase